MYTILLIYLNPLPYRIVIILISLNYSFNLFSQSNLNPDNVNLIKPNELKEFLNKPALNSKLIGLGEATHGTKEFSEIKSDIVKILVTHYNYKYFILEAGFTDCIKINEFIQNKSDDSLNLFKGLPWPWATTEFYDILVWMRNYNFNQKEPINFFGADVGNKGSIKFYKNQFSDTLSKSFVNNLIDIYADTLKSTKYKITLLNTLRKSIPKIDNFIDSIKMTNIFETLQSLLLKGGARYKFRENTFANLTIKIIDHYSPNSKFIIWAHNSHISKYSNSRKSVGYFLTKHYSEKYTNFLFEFKKGTFRAVDTDSNRYENKIFKFTNFYISPDLNKFGSQIMPDSLNYIIINIKSPLNRNLTPRTFYIHSIGAVYSLDLAKRKPALYKEKIYKNRTCDYLIIVNQTTASNNFYQFY